jgi:hypothetical protein
LSGRFARICGNSFPRVIHSTCDTFQTEVHPSVKNQSGRLDRLHLGKPIAKHVDTDLSFLVKRTSCPLERHVANPLQVCPPFFKDIGPMPYRDYIIKATAPCI